MFQAVLRSRQNAVEFIFREAFVSRISTINNAANLVVRDLTKTLQSSEKDAESIKSGEGKGNAPEEKEMSDRTKMLVKAVAMKVSSSFSRDTEPISFDDPTISVVTS